MKSFEANNSTEASGFVGNVSDQISHEFTSIQTIKESEMHFVAQGCRFGRMWILKGLAVPYRANEACLALLLKEFEIMVRLNHNNIVRANTIEEVPGWGMCIVMEYIDGMTLPEWLSRGPSHDERLRVAMELIDALEYVSRCDIVHRDIKPDNIMLTRLGNSVKIIDFGLADSDSFTIFKQPAGTPGYMSPEQLESTVPQIGNDIFSLGKVLEKLLSEKRYRPVIDACLKDASQRPATFAEVKNMLARQTKASRIKNILVVSAVVLAVVAIALLVLLLLQTNRQHPAHEEVVAEEHVAPTEDIAPATPAPQTPIQHAEEPVTAKVPPLTSKEATVTAPVVVPKATPTETIHKSDANELAEQGRAQIRDLWQNTAMNYLDTLTNIEEMHVDWSTTNLERLRDEFMKSLPSDMSNDERGYIRNELNQQIESSYKEWTERRLKMK